MLALLVPSLAAAQGTYAPDAVTLAVDNSGNIISGGKLCTYAAGTSTPATTYTAADYSASNTNPVIADSAGRMTVFLRPGTSYKFVLRQPGTDATCATGSVLWTRDNVLAVPVNSGNIDFTGTVGEPVTAGQAVYLSDGSGGKVAGQFYKADSTNAYSSASAGVVGIAPSAIASGESGTIRLEGRATGLSSLTIGSIYYVGVAGALTATLPANARVLGTADSATSLVLVAAHPPAAADNGINDFRLTLTSGVPVTTADVTAATTLYCTPTAGNRIALYNSAGAATVYSSAEFSIAVPATTATMYDIFAYANAGVPTLELLAWSSDTARATAIVLTTTGVYTKSGDLTRRYLGSFRTTGVSGQTEDSIAKRYLWNYYHRARRVGRVLEATDSWVYTTATWRQANGAAANQLDFVIGVAEVAVHVEAVVSFTGGAGVLQSLGIGEDSTSAIAAGSTAVLACANNVTTSAHAVLDKFPAVGRHIYVWLEYSVASSTTTWYGDNGAATLTQSGISGWVEGE